MAKRPAVLVLMWRREHELRACLEAIAQLKPSALYVSGDGPRGGRHDDKNSISYARKAVDALEAEFPVYTNFSADHRGLRESVISGIEWFLGAEGEGIILEDDIIPSAGFFDFAERNLERFRTNLQVSQIAGINHSEAIRGLESELYFSQFQHVWGFATWERSWEDFRTFCASADPAHLRTEQVFPNFPRTFHRHWERRIRRELEGESDTWTASWNYFCAALQRLSVVPRETLVQNIGFGREATNSKRVPLIAGYPPEMSKGLLEPTPHIPVEADAKRDLYVASWAWATQPSIQRFFLATAELWLRLWRHSAQLFRQALRLPSEPWPRRLTAAQRFYRWQISRAIPSNKPTLREKTAEPATEKGPEKGSSPALVIAWARPAKTARLLTRLRECGVSRVYVWADGPREREWLDSWICLETRKRIESFSREFELKTRFSERNQGLQKSVIGAITWFFEDEQHGVVLEDDVLPTKEFFSFVGWALERHERDNGISQVAGTTHSQNAYGFGNSPYLSRFHHVWGFATWKRAWTGFPEFFEKTSEVTREQIRAVLPGFWSKFYKHWSKRVDKGRTIEVEWDSMWNVFNFLRGSRSLSPPHPLTLNSGFDGVGTHSRHIPLIAGPPPTIASRASQAGQREDWRFASQHEADKLDTYTAATHWNTQASSLRLFLAMLEFGRRRFLPGGRFREKVFSPMDGSQYFTVAQKLFQKLIFR